MTELRGADAALVRDALEAGDPLPGTAGFAGSLDGRIVRDALGREPLFVERAALPLEPDEPRTEPAAGRRWPLEADDWAFAPDALAEPELLPAGTVLDERGLREIWPFPQSDASPDAAAENRSTADGGGSADVDRGESADVAGGSAVAPLDDPVAALDEAIEDSLASLDDGTPVAFSGGVDSALVADATGGPLYVAGFPDSHDVEAARSAAAAMDRDLTVLELDHDDLERAVRAVVDATGRTNGMDVSIAVPLYLVAERAAADGHDRLALGQGADELFGGYAKVARAPEGDDRLDATSVVAARDETIASLPEQLPRDVLAIRAAGIEPVTPLLHDRVVEAALQLPADLLVDGERRKVALREAATERLPDAVAERDKKALQYGSLVSRELDRLARQNGFKRRMDDHVSKYVADLVERE